MSDTNPIISRGIEWSHWILLAKIRWVLACSCSQNFCYCSHARIFGKIPLWKNVLRNLTEKCTRYECFRKHIIHPRFADVLLKLAQVTILLERAPALAKVESNLELWWHVEYYQYYSTLRACQRGTASIG